MIDLTEALSRAYINAEGDLSSTAAYLAEMDVPESINGPVADLCAAAIEIVDGTRSVFTEHGQDARELRRFVGRALP